MTVKFKSGEPWTMTEIKLVKSLAKEGKNPREIAVVIGRSFHSVRCQMVAHKIRYIGDKIKQNLANLFD